MRILPPLAVGFALVFAPAAQAQDSVFESYFEAGKKAFDEKKWEDAAKYYKLAAKEGDRQNLKNQSQAAALHNAAAALSNINKWSEALPLAEKAKLIYTDVLKGYQEDNIRCTNLLGLCYYEAKRHEEAVTFLEWAVYAVDESGKLPEILPYSLLCLGSSRLETDDLKKAEADLRRSRKLYSEKKLHGGEGDALRYLARVSLKRKEDDDAYDLFEEASERYLIYAKDAKNGYALVSNCYDEMIAIRTRQKSPEAVLKLQKRVEEILGEGPAASRAVLARRHYDRAWDEKNANKYKDAEASARKAVEAYDRVAGQYEQSVFVHALLGSVLARRGEAAAAEKEFKLAIAMAEEFEPADGIDRRWVYAQFADYLMDRSKPAEALPILKKALEAAERKDGSDSESAATALSDLVGAYGELKRWSDALSAAERQLAIVEKLKGKTAPQVVGPLQQLAWVHEKQKDVGKAERMLKRALAIREEHGGPGKSTTFSSVQRLARLYQSDNRPDDAEKLYRRTVAEWEKALGAEHPDLAFALGGLASFLTDAGKYEEAEKLLRRALENREKAHGPNHRSVAESLYDLVDFFHELGRQAEAEPLLKRGLKIYETTDGPRSASVASTLNKLGWVHIRQQRFEDGVPLAKKALEINEELGVRLRTLAQSCNTLAAIVKSLDRFAEAESLYRKALDCYEKDDGPEQLGVAIVCNNLGGLCSSTDRHEEAEALYRRSITLKKKAGIDTAEGVTDRLNRAGNLSRSMSNLAALLRDLQREPEALEFSKAALEIREKYLGKQHPDTLGNLIQLAGFAARRGDYAEREALYARAAEIRTKIYTNGEVGLADNHSEAATLHRHHGRFADAEAEYRKAEAILDKHYEGDPIHLAWLWQTRGEMFANLGRFAEARKELQKVLSHYEKSRPASTSHASAMLELADLELAVGDLAAANKLEEAAFKIYFKAYGRGTPPIRWLITRQAFADIRAGKYAEARAKLEKLNAEWEKDAPNTPNSLVALQNLAWIDVLEGKDAEPRYAAALKLSEKFHGSDPYYRGSLLVDRAAALLRAHKAAEAEVPARQAFEAYSKRLGASHPSTASAALLLGRILAATGKTTDAERLIADAKSTRDKLLGAEHPETAETRRAEAELAAAGKRWAEAAQLYAACVKIRDAKYPADHPETRAILEDWLAAMKAGGRTDDAKSVQDRLAKFSK